ncbi:hypothetical protein DFH09DRAFT_1317714 [Mycena vulgaris]|nr:hypothetical protein DFH09DRAFT_1317714 [Mycena vulgaris]
MPAPLHPRRLKSRCPSSFTVGSSRKLGELAVGCYENGQLHSLVVDDIQWETLWHSISTQFSAYTSFTLSLGFFPACLRVQNSPVKFRLIRKRNIDLLGDLIISNTAGTAGTAVYPRTLPNFVLPPVPDRKICSRSSH